MVHIVIGCSSDDESESNGDAILDFDHIKVLFVAEDHNDDDEIVIVILRLQFVIELLMLLWLLITKQRFFS